MKTKVLVLLLALMMVFTATAVSASTALIEPLSENANFIYFEETAQFSLTITNTRSTDQVYNINANPVDWLIESQSSIRVSPGETKTIDLFIRPRQSNYKTPGFYGVPVRIASANDNIDAQTVIYIRSVNDGGYVPAVTLSIQMDSAVDPRSSIPVTLNFRNRNILDIDALEIRIQSELFSLNEVTTLNALEEKSMEFWFSIDPQTLPDEYEIDARLFYQNKSVSQAKKVFEVNPYAVIERNALKDKKVFFKSTKVSELTNKANIQKTLTSELDIPFYERIFTTIKFDANAIDKVGRLKWDIVFEPEEKVTITVTQNYRAIPLILFLALVTLVLYFVLRTPIVLKKQTIVTGKDNEGVSEMRVRVFIRNRTGRSFYNVRLLDRVPSIASVHVTDSLGVLPPTDIVRTEKKGTLIKWDFEVIEPFEERIVTYNVSAKLKLVGPLGLPPVKAKFETVKGKHKTTESGKAQVGGMSK
jgi:hypothetical protein